MTSPWRLGRGCVRLSEWEGRWTLRAAVSTRAAGDMKQPMAFSRFLRAQGLAPDCWAGVEQAHGGRVVAVTRAGPPEEPAADGLMTRSPGLALRVFTADCVPVFLLDPRRRAIALLHAGWRGVRGGILPRAVRALTRRFGSRPGDVRLALGPHIRDCCYEIGPDVSRYFARPRGALSWRGTARHPRRTLNLAEVLRDQARRAGVREEHVAVAPWCTRCDPRFFSFRRNRTARRQAAVLSV